MSVLRSNANSVDPLPKLCGSDIELGNFIDGIDRVGGTCYEASRAVLAEIRGLPANGNSSYAYEYASRASYADNPDNDSGRGVPGGCSYFGTHGGSRSTVYESSVSTHDPMDIGRRFLASNGGCAYIDLGHVELCTPEVVSAFDHVASWHAMLRIAREALNEANRGRPSDQPIKILVNNSDGIGNSYGSHLSFLLRRRTWDNIFYRKAHYLQFLASFQVSSILLTGQGKVGAENGRSRVPYQISQRADFLERLAAVQTQYHRGITNSRQEALCGRSRGDNPQDPARLHCIFFDSALAHGSALFRVGLMQLVLTLIELGLVNSRLILDDPVDAVLAYSHDSTLKAHAELISGERFTALELQSAYLDDVKRYADRGLFEGIVPGAREIVALWEDSLVKLAKRDWMGLAPRLDWVMKLMAIERALDERPQLDWDSPEIKVVDQMYSSLDDGLYWVYEGNGFAEQLVSGERIAHFTANPPEDTRAWARAMLLRRVEPEDVINVDWDSITLRLPGRSYWPRYRRVELPDPLGLSRAEVQPIFEHSKDLESVLEAVQAQSKCSAPATDGEMVN